jgi:hypothetical protein
MASENTTTQQPHSARQIILMLLLAVAGSLAVFLLQSHTGLSLRDEGLLWYNAQRVMVGEVPIRDFTSYDIGRYYWSAAFMNLLGDNGIVTLRVATAAFQTMGVFIGLTLLARSHAKQNIFFWLLVIITLMVWMSPQYRLFDNSLPIVLIGALSFLVEQPARHRYFLAGLTVGLVAVFGRNHGIYGVAGSLCTMIYLTAKCQSSPSLTSAFIAWVAGVVVGYLPVLLFIAAVPGFAPAFWDSICYLFEIRATNIPLPIPWPWAVPFEILPTGRALRGVAIGAFFVAIVIFGVMGAAWSIWRKLQNKRVSFALIASVFLALPYAHYAYSRADIEHLAPGVFPFLIGIFALLASQPAKIKWPFAALLCGASLLVMLPTHSGWYCYKNPQCVETNVAGDKLKIDRETAGMLTDVNELAEQFAPGNRAFLIAPLWPGAYAALGRKAPMWDTYAILPRSIAFQQGEIERIKTANPGFVIIGDMALDGREDLRFRNTHQIIDRYIRDHFECLNCNVQNPAFRVYRSNQAGQ